MHKEKYACPRLCGYSCICLSNVFSLFFFFGHINKESQCRMSTRSSYYYHLNLSWHLYYYYYYYYALITINFDPMVIVIIIKIVMGMNIVIIVYSFIILLHLLFFFFFFFFIIIIIIVLVIKILKQTLVWACRPGGLPNLKQVHLSSICLVSTPLLSF